MAVAVRRSLDDETIRRLCDQIDSRYPTEEDVTNLAVAMAMATFGEPQETHDIKCIACEDRYPAKKVFWQAPCGHDYCIACVEELHSASMHDETLFPPRCCQREMPWNSVRIVVDDELEAVFDAKREELSTSNRTYCSEATCAVFIGANHIVGNRATCPTCHKTTCTLCKTAAHAGACPPDENTRKTLELAEDQGWCRCRKCHNLVELSFGCNHIICRCRHEFCYACGHAWKTCGCEQWSQRRLYARAEDIVDRDAEAAAAAPLQRRRRVNAEAERLRRQRECDDHDWRFNHGAAECEECHYDAPVFTMMCRACRLRVCRRCMHNRL